MEFLKTTLVSSDWAQSLKDAGFTPPSFFSYVQLPGTDNWSIHPSHTLSQEVNVLPAYTAGELLACMPPQLFMDDSIRVADFHGYHPVNKEEDASVFIVHFDIMKPAWGDYFVAYRYNGAVVSASAKGMEKYVPLLSSGFHLPEVLAAHSADPNGLL